jgi:hypothetical protein
MSTVDLRIGRVHQKLDVSGAPAGTEERLRRLAPTAFDRLAGLLGEFGDNNGHWCIRELACTVSLDVDASDEVLLSAWALDLIAGVHGATHRVEDADDVVFYPNRDLAVLDCIVSTEAGRTERWWAWRQLGLVSAEEATDSEGGLDYLRLLLDSPRVVTPGYRTVTWRRSFRSPRPRRLRCWSALRQTPLLAQRESIEGQQRHLQRPS